MRLKLLQATAGVSATHLHKDGADGMLSAAAIVDASLERNGHLRDPLIVRLLDRRVASTVGRWVRGFLTLLDSGGLDDCSVAALGDGTNASTSIAVNTVAELVQSTALIALGTGGGAAPTAIHLDAVSTHPTFDPGGRCRVQHGVLRGP